MSKISDRAREMLSRIQGTDAGILYDLLEEHKRLEAAAQEEPEWEYSADIRKSYIYNSLARTRDFHPVPEKIWRRRKAGDWEEVQ